MLPIAKVVSMKEEDAYRWFMPARFPETKGVAYCPACGTLDSTPVRRKRFVCTAQECRKEFSVTSGTILASRKLSFKTLLLALALSVHSVKGKAACELKRELAVDYKTAFVLMHKLREAIADAREHLKLDGVVEMDAMYLGGHVKPKNVKADRVDRRLAENQSGRRMAVMALRERKANGRTLAAAVPGEQGAVAWHLVKNHVLKGAELRADQNPAYDELVGLHPLMRNDHSVAYVQEPGSSTNQAESFFSRVRRAEVGTHHRISGKYLDWYAADVAWREDMSRTDFRTQARMVLASALRHGNSRNMAGYWQRLGKADEPLVGWNPMANLAP